MWRYNGILDQTHLNNGYLVKCTTADGDKKIDITDKDYTIMCWFKHNDPETIGIGRYHRQYLFGEQTNTRRLQRSLTYSFF